MSGSGTGALHAVVYTALRAADEALGLPSEAAQRYPALLPRQRALVLKPLITLARRSRRGRRAACIALQYASFNSRQRWRSAKVTAWGRLPSATAEQRAASRLPGE